MKYIKFSLVVPLAPDRGAPVIDSVKKQNYPKENYEIIIKRGTNASENRNKGIKEAKHEHVVILDDDAELDLNYLKNANHFFKKYKEIDIVGGPQLTPKEDKLFSKMSGHLLGSFLATQKMAKRYTKRKLSLDTNEISITSANLIVKKRIFKKIKGFDPDLFPGEDPEFFARAKQAGFKLAYSPKLVVYHKRRPTYYSFLKQFFLYGYMRNKKEKKTKGDFNLIWYIPSLCIIYLFFTPLLIFFSRLFLMPYLFYFSLVILFTLYETLRNKELRLIFFLPWLYPSIHLAYGLGMLWWVIREPRK